MGFRTANLARLVQFNSSVSSSFLDMYKNNLEKDIVAEDEKKPSQTIAPSSVRCERKTWFRLRGVEPDKNKKPDLITQHTADMGTAIHELIQARLSRYLGDDWIDVDDYLNNHASEHSYSTEKYGFETRIEFFDIPIRFSCDGILRIDGNYYLLEIKSSDTNSFSELMDVKDEHIDQVKCYCSLLDINNALVLYVDRLYGDMKCYEVEFKHYEKSEVISNLKRLQQYADSRLAPEGLPRGDKWCGMCVYSRRCEQYGR